MSLRDIKGKIRAVGKTRQVTRAMEAVSAAKMRRSQERALSARPYATSAFKILRRLSGSFNTREHFLVKERDMRKVLIILVTSDRGLAGGLNSSVIKKVLAFIKEKNISKQDVAFACIGKKGYEYFSKRGYVITEHFEKFGDAPPLKVLEDVSRHALELYKAGAYDHVLVAYSNFVSTFVQEPILHKVLPLHVEDIAQVIKSIVPVRGKYSDMYKDEENGNGNGFTDYLFEPAPEAVFEQLVFDLITVLAYHGFVEAKASEFSARMVAMRSASDKALEMGNSLTLSYNKARQSAITREVSEIVGGVEALAAN